MSPAEIKAKRGLSQGISAAAPSVSLQKAAWFFQKFHIDEIKKQEERELTRFDLDFDLPDHFLPEFPPPHLLTTAPT